MSSSTPIYSLRSADVYSTLETSPQGLPEGEAVARRELYGSNVLEKKALPPAWRRLLRHVNHRMAVVLWIAGLLSLGLGRAALGISIWALVVLNALLSFWREHRAEVAMEALRRLLPAYARVVREGTEQRLPASELVPGDVLVLAEGDNIPADARVVEEFGLRTNNASLTGEAMPARKTADASLSEGISEVERPNLVFAGTSVVSGTGRAVVFSTGMLTQFGRIARLTQAVPEVPSPLQGELLRVTRRLAAAALAAGGLVFVLAMFDVHMTWPEAFLLAVGIAVAFLPEGLPATVTLSLAMAGQRLAARKVLVKRLAVIETLGTVSIICTDKSGTLTQNQMTVREVWVSRKKMKVSGVGYEPQGKFTPSLNGSPAGGDLRILLTAASLCNNSRLIPPSAERPQWSSLGDQTEAALRVAALKAGIDQEVVLQRNPRTHELPFDARRKRMSTIHGQQVYVKGAPREVLLLCTHIQLNGEVCPLDEALRAEILQANDDYSRRALRVLALARRDLPPRSGAYTPEKVERELTFLGLMGMMDPPRPEVAEAVQTCQQAGIRMVMITGDYGLTAESVARRVGMLTTPNPRILTGAEVDAMSDAELAEAIQEEVIFARMAPEHKLRLVDAFQAAGEVVAVTGDGVNDAPALRKADVGVAMGLTGTDVAKEAADLVLTDDNFAAIIQAIEEGRSVYANLRKFITYIFTSNVPEILPFVLTALFQIPLALRVPQILAIDMGTDLFPALALGMEKPEPDAMQRKPRRKSEPLIDRSLLRRSFLWLGLIEAALCYIGYFAVYTTAGGLNLLSLPPSLWGTIPELLRSAPAGVHALAVTVFHAGVVAAQVGNAFACRTERNRGRELGWFSNPYLFLGVGIEITIILALIYVPLLNRLFEHAALPARYWLGLALFAPALYGLDWLRKQWVRRKDLKSLPAQQAKTL